MLKLRVSLLLLMAGVAFSNADKQTNKCLAECNQKCTAGLNSCMKRAKDKAAIRHCQQNQETCKMNCVNKACR